jgi:hypothetical protein
MNIDEQIEDLKKRIEELEEQRRLEQVPETVSISFYAHSSKDSNCELFCDITAREDGSSIWDDISEEARKAILYAMYEMSADYLINLKTGEYKITGVEVDGKKFVPYE